MSERNQMIREDWEATPGQMPPKMEQSSPKENPRSDTSEASQLNQAEAVAGVLLGAANNAIRMGGDLLVGLKKEESFYEYDELIPIIEEQNRRNVDRLCFDESEIALLRSPLAAILVRRGKVLSPEHQLAIAGISIMIKKAKMVMEMRAENQILLSRVAKMIESKKKAKAEAAGPEPSPVIANDQPVTTQESIQTEIQNQGNEFSGEKKNIKEPKVFENQASPNMSLPDQEHEVSHESLHSEHQLLTRSEADKGVPLQPNPLNDDHSKSELEANKKKSEEAILPEIEKLSPPLSHEKSPSIESPLRSNLSVADPNHQESIPIDAEGPISYQDSAQDQHIDHSD